MKKLIGMVVLCLTFGVGKVAADDIEIYLNSSAGGTPYVLLVLDLRSSTFSTACNKFSNCGPPYMSQKAYDKLTEFGSFGANDKVSLFEVFRAVLAGVLENTAFDGIQFAIAGSNWADGGTMLDGYKLLKTHRADLISTLAAMPGTMSGKDAHEFGAKETYYEWFRYITGGDVLYGDETSGNFKGTQVPDYDTTIITGNSYDSPFQDPQACSKLFSIAVAMQGPPKGQDGSADNAIKNDPYLSAQPNFPNNGFSKIEDLLQFMHASTTDLLPIVNGTQPLEKSWVISDDGSVGQTRDMAQAGGSGVPLSLSDPQQLEVDLTNIFKEVISVSSTFVAASVPVNVFNQAESLDNLFIALFEAQTEVRWPGNVKKLRLADTFDPADPNNPAARDGVFDEIVDVNGNPGFESTGDNRGRITFDAVTFWTDVASLPPPGADPTIPLNADGRVVARGGAGQKIPGFVDDGTHTIGDSNSATTRNLYVEPETVTNGANNSLVDFNATDATLATVGYLETALGAASSAEAKALIRWARGQDVDDEDGDGNSSEARSWVLADAIHSRPFALNYGATAGYSQDNPNIRLFLGTGDGIFHAIENTDTSGNETGKELYGFLPRDVLGIVPVKRTNSEPSGKMRYGVDGPPVVMTRDVNGDGDLIASDGDEAYIYFGLRRGGMSYYALDVSDPSVAPVLKWKITQTSGGDFDNLGLTFSEPVVGRVRFGNDSTDVLIFAAGYNGGWNAGYTARVGKDAGDADDSIGNAIYIVNARTGELIWKAVYGGSTGSVSNTEYNHTGLVDSIPSRVAVLRDNNGNIHRLYVGDTGGAIWRVDLPVGSGADHRLDNWFITKFAELGTDGATTDRRFFHAPDLVEVVGSDDVPFDGVLISSGNRADPNETDVTNFHFYLKDFKITSGDATVKSRSPLAIGDLEDQTDCVIGTEPACAAGFPKGWKIELERAGEKGLSTPLTDGGRVFFTTFVPSSGAATCAPTEGEGSVYVVNLADGTAAENNIRIYDIGPGIPPGAILVGDVILLPGGGIDLEDLDQDGDRDSSKLPQVKGSRLFRIYWREPGIDKL